LLRLRCVVTFTLLFCCCCYSHFVVVTLLPVRYLLICCRCVVRSVTVTLRYRCCCCYVCYRYVVTLLLLLFVCCLLRCDLRCARCCLLHVARVTFATLRLRLVAFTFVVCCYAFTFTLLLFGFTVVTLLRLLLHLLLPFTVRWLLFVVVVGCYVVCDFGVYVTLFVVVEFVC